MAGLFGESWDDPRTALMLSLASGLLGGRGNTAARFGQGMTAGLGAYQDARRMQMAAEQQAMQRQLMQSQIDENVAQVEQRKAAAAMAQAELQRQLQLREYLGGIGKPQYPVGSTAMTPQGQALMQNAPTRQFSAPEFLARGGKTTEIDDVLKGLNYDPDPIKHWDKGTLPGVAGERVVGVRASGKAVPTEITPRPERPLVNINTAKGPENKFIDKLQDLQAIRYDQAGEASREAQEGNNALARIKTLIEQGGVTGGPLASQVVIVRNLASQVGLPIDKALDQRNAMFTAEFTSRLANKVLAGGRAITDNDARLIARAFPGFENGIPSEQLPAFIAALEAINNEKVSYFAELEKRVNPQLRERMPITFTNPSAAGVTAAQPSPAALPGAMDSNRVIEFNSLPKGR